MYEVNREFRASCLRVFVASTGIVSVAASRKESLERQQQRRQRASRTVSQASRTSSFDLHSPVMMMGPLSPLSLSAIRG